jgi:hypothetical protein
MRTLIKFLLVAAVCVGVFSSCKEEARNTAPLIDPWLRDRTPVTFVLEGQVGSPVIVDNWRNDEVGTVNVTLVVGGLDMSNVGVEQLVLPKDATASIENGSTLDFSSGEATFTVTSATNEKRVYTVTYAEFQEPLQGTYAMEQVKGPDSGVLDVVVVVGGFTGYIVVSSLTDKNWKWQGGSGNLSRQFDNIISFRLEDVDSETGHTFGTVVNYWGADGLYADYIWTGGSPDLSGFYQNVPKGQSKWKKWTEKVGDNEYTRVTFYKYSTTDYAEADVLFTSDWWDAVDSYTFTYADGTANKPVTVPSGAFHRSFPGPWETVDQSDMWGDHRWMRDNVRETFNMVKKTSDDPSPDHDTWLGMTFN